jgi:hypothetical protein
MEGLREHLGVLRRRGVRVESHGGEAGDEHDLDVGVELGRPARELDAVHLRHHDVGEQELERLLAQPLIGREPVVVGDDVVAGGLQRLHQEAPHVGIIFCQKDLRGHATSRPNLSAEGPGNGAGPDPKE